ncbi:aminotransferase class V-fold PLP-dependent enzyme [Parvularcula dongshanensis]|uniref:Kynureninase n=1 Tax=Parvularcula dongshanensis TaxID=1173995 RepID=A0A840I1M3_9PROT|nr:aminotransferase class V-fold PLP-dependent enzyme [Parvularcula dongshanensis]MBB4658719.1 kynureninase [Parvularcula dongshanensis]
MLQTPETRSEAAALDLDDPLAPRRAAFALPEGIVYLDGHSLGPATHAALDAVRRGAGGDWAEGLIRSWNTAGWIDAPRRVGDKLGAFLGAEPGEVIVADNVTVNLFKLAAAALPLARAPEVMADGGEFPTDGYIAQGLGVVGARRVRRERFVPGETAFGGVLIKSLVDYRTAQVADVRAVEEHAAAQGGLVVWDLSHAAGVVPCDLPSMRLAAGCTYKYLNGGPGAPAYLYAEAGLAERMSTPIQGWFGHADPFAFDSDYRPRPGAARFATGTPPVLSLVALEAALEVLDGVDGEALWAKAGALGDLCVARLRALGLPLESPVERRKRGGHVAFRHPEGYAVVQALIARGVIADFRAPETVRFGLSPLTLSFAEVWDAMDHLEAVLADKLYMAAAYQVRATVT